MALADLIKRESGILEEGRKPAVDESKELDAGLAFRDKKFSKGTGKEGVDEVGAIYKPFMLSKKGNPLGDKLKYVLPIAFTRGNYLYFYLLAEQPNSKTGVKVDTLYNELTGSAATVAALNNVRNSANAQYVDMEGNFLTGEKHFARFDLGDDSGLAKYKDVEHQLYKWGSSPKPSKIIVGWKNEEDLLDQKDAGTMSAKILLNLATDDGKIGTTSYVVRLSNAKDGGKPKVSSVHYTTKTIGAGQEFPEAASAIQTFVQNQWSGTDYTKVEGGSRVKSALTGKNSGNYVAVAGNIVNFKGLLDTGIYKKGSSSWQNIVDWIVDSVDKANASESFSPGLLKLFEHWKFFDWKDDWKYTKWLLSECARGNIQVDEAMNEIGVPSFSDGLSRKPSGQASEQCKKVMKEALKVIQECVAAIDEANGEQSLQEGFLDTLKGKLRQKLGKAAGTGNWLEDYTNKNLRNTSNWLAANLVKGTLEKILGDENLNMAELFKGIFGSDIRFGKIKEALKGQDSGLKPVGQILAQMYNAGAKINLNSNSTDEQLNKGLNIQGYVGKVADAIKNTAFGKAAAEIDKQLAAGGTLGGAQRKGTVADISSDPFSDFTPAEQAKNNQFIQSMVAESESDPIAALFRQA